MIKQSISIRGKINSSIKIKGKTNLSVVIIEPELENLEVIPSLEEQYFKSKKDGYNEVTVKKIETENLDVTPEPQEKRFDGVYKEVVIRGDSDLKPENIKKGIKIFNIDGAFDAVDTRDANAMSSELLEEKTAYVNNQKITGSIKEYKGEQTGGTEAFQTEEIEVQPGKQDQIVEGLFNKVVIAGDESLASENIKAGVELFDTVGAFTADANATEEDIISDKTAYVNGKKVTGKIVNNGELQYIPSEEEQIIPAGLTTGGTIKATDITKLSEYEACLTLANSIEDLEDYNDTTATPEDVLKDKIFYANGERQIGTLEVASNEELEDSFISAIDDSLGSRTTKLPQGLRTIGAYAFQYCTNLALKELPDSVYKIDSHAFAEATYLPLEKLPSSLKTIGAYAFYKCTSLKIQEMPDTVTTMNTYAFSGCTSLPLQKLSSKLTIIKDYAFSGCTKLALTELPDSITKIEAYAFSGCSTMPLRKLSANLTTIQNYAFNGCTKLDVQEIPETVTTLNPMAFYGCTSLTLKKLPSSIKTIAGSLFYNCRALTEMTCEGPIATVSSSCFYGCTNFGKLVFLNITAVPTLSNRNSFTNTLIASGTGLIYVPDELVDAFKAASNWSSYADQIKGVSELV